MILFKYIAKNESLLFKRFD